VQPARHQQFKEVKSEHKIRKRGGGGYHGEDPEFGKTESAPFWMKIATEAKNGQGGKDFGKAIREGGGIFFKGRARGSPIHISIDEKSEKPIETRGERRALI